MCLYLLNLCSMITNAALCTSEVKTRIAKAKEVFNKKKNFSVANLN